MDYQVSRKPKMIDDEVSILSAEHFNSEINIESHRTTLSRKTLGETSKNDQVTNFMISGIMQNFRRNIFGLGILS